MSVLYQMPKIKKERCQCHKKFMKLKRKKCYPECSYRSMRDADDNGEKFWLWMDEIEHIVKKKLGINLVELTDQPYRDFHIDSYKADQVAKIITDEFELI
jgi:hypothetical protein